MRDAHGGACFSSCFLFSRPCASSAPLRRGAQGAALIQPLQEEQRKLSGDKRARGSCHGATGVILTWRAAAGPWLPAQGGDAPGATVWGERQQSRALAPSCGSATWPARVQRWGRTLSHLTNSARGEGIGVWEVLFGAAAPRNPSGAVSSSSGAGAAGSSTLGGGSRERLFVSLPAWALKRSPRGSPHVSAGLRPGSSWKGAPVPCGVTPKKRVPPLPGGNIFPHSLQTPRGAGLQMWRCGKQVAGGCPGSLAEVCLEIRALKRSPRGLPWRAGSSEQHRSWRGDF